MKSESTFKIMPDGSYEARTILPKELVDQMKEKCQQDKELDIHVSLKQAAILDLNLGYLSDAKSIPELMRRILLLLQVIGDLGQPILALKTHELLMHIMKNTREPIHGRG